MVSWFHPNRGRDRYRDRLFNHRTLSWGSGFLVSGFHPNRGRDRGRDRYRYRYRRPATRDIRPATIDRDARVPDTAGRFSGFQGFRVSRFLVSGFLVSGFHRGRGRDRDRDRYRDRGRHKV